MTYYSLFIRNNNKKPCILAYDIEMAVKLGELNLDLLKKLFKKYSVNKDIQPYLDEILIELITKMMEYYKNSPQDVGNAIKYKFKLCYN